MRKLTLIFFAVLCMINVYSQQHDTASASLQKDSIKSSTLKVVTVTGRKPAVQIFPDKTIINVDAGMSNAGATLLEVLEKSPGISMDRNGNISLKGKQGVNIMIDGKPAQVSGNDLNNLLSGITAAQVDQIEIIDNPSSKYDASGNAGIINIKTKKNRQKGFNGNLSMALGQGRYTRTVNSINLNYFAGKINAFANLGININKNFTDLYALRTYFKSDNKTIASFLEQPSYFKGRAPSKTLKTGIDYFIDQKTTVGFVASGTLFSRKTIGNTDAIWMNENKLKDSVIITDTRSKDKLVNGSLNVNARHSFSSTSELTADVDYLGYKITNNQLFTNRLDAPNGYIEQFDGNVPSAINIVTAKADYSSAFDNGLKFETGWKSSFVRTNNRADYFYTDQDGTQPDLGKTNHFIYSENIHAAYINIEKRTDKITMQAGVRYENTGYDAQQLGNALRKDSSFSRKYDDLFPNALFSVQLDSGNTISVSAGRRIDRPPYQALNPFVFVINKYTYQQGNPYYLPQYTWNTEFNYSYKDIIVATLAYSYTKDYFSQLFLTDTNGIIIYTEGNLDQMTNLGLSVSAQAAPLHWWSFSAQAGVNYKKIKGFVDRERTASLVQSNFNINNQFNFNKGWSGELSGFFSLREQELQEITDPTGQLTAGISKQILKNQGTLKFLVRDIFYTQAMKGNTSFNLATEYFKLTRDTRSASIAFTYRFGKPAKTGQRKTGGAEDEIRRVNTAG